MLNGFAIAFGIGLLIGVERERHKDNPIARSAAGVRTFTVVCLMGAVAWSLGGRALLALAVLVVAAGALAAYQKNAKRSPGLTTEFSLVLTCLLGGFAMEDGALSAGLGVVLACVLASRSRLHHFIGHVLTPQDWRDMLAFFAITLILVPLAPDKAMGPFDAIHPRALTLLVATVMAVSAAGYIGMRWLGPKHGLPWAGLASGFVSSAATIHAMGRRARQDNTLAAPAVAGAVLSSIATIIQMSVVIALVQPSLLQAMAWPLVVGGAVATLYGLFFYLKSASSSWSVEPQNPGRAFDLTGAIGFATLLAVVIVGSAALNAWSGDAGVLVGAALSGFADAHATAASAASLLAAGKINSDRAVVLTLLGLTTNAITKAVLAFNAGGLSFGLKIVPGLVLMVSGAWLAFWFLV